MSPQIQAAQSYFSPSWIPKTRHVRPMPLSAMPTRSKWRLLVDTCGTSFHASARPMMPTGTLTKKIHSQPRPSTSPPPASGPISVATPATVPQTPIAAPRLFSGKILVISAIVCGVISAAPTPCRPRARMSISIEPANPHHTLATVNTTRPTRYTFFGPYRSPRRPATSMGTA